MRKKSSTATNIFLSGAIALGVILRLVWVGKREFWYDEVLSVLFASGQKAAYQIPENTPFNLQEISVLLHQPTGGSPVTAIKEVLKGTLGDPHPPLSYLGEALWLRLFGNSELALRSLMLLVSLMALGVAYFVGRRVLGHRGGLIFTALLSLNPFFLAHSLNLRMYAPMVLWVLLSAGCLLALVDIEKRETTDGYPAQKWQTQKWMLQGGIAIALAAGLLTQYLFAYWLFAIAALALYLDRKRWFQHGLTLLAGILLFMPWFLWGTLQQINNRKDVLNQISAVGGPLQSALAHGMGLAQTLANHLFLGHLTTGMLPLQAPIKPTAVALGCGVIGFLAVCVNDLFRRRQYRILTISVLMGLLPLAVALAIDVVTNKYTLGFGWGRSAMVALPGCVLLVAAWLELGTGRWRMPLTALLLAVYLGVNVMDFGGRDRQMFHRVQGYLPVDSEPVLVVMNSQAWGHVLRLAYYGDSPTATNLEVLAVDPANVVEALDVALLAKDYRRVLWLRAEKPLWGAPASEVEAAAFSEETERLLQDRYPAGARATEVLEGTMDLDAFVLQVYE